jgi:Na+/proline symporter
MVPSRWPSAQEPWVSRDGSARIGRGLNVISGWLLLVVAALYVGVLFAVAWKGDRQPLYPSKTRLRPLVYSLALAVYCSSWTFYGAVGTAARDGLAYLPIYLGPALLFILGFGLMTRLVTVAGQRNITTIADFIGARFGKSHGLAALVALIAVTAVVPYLALQFKAMAMSLDVLSDTGPNAIVPSTDSALWCALLLAAFAILFGTRSIDASEHHHGMMLAIALESVIKLLAFLGLGVYALWRGPGLDELLKLPQTPLTHGQSPGFLAQALLAFCAMFCLPRQFQIGVVECEDPRDLRRARWMFPLYMLLISVGVVPIVAAGMNLPAVRGGLADAWVLNLPLAHGDRGVALIAFLGGFSAATGMVIVSTVALSTMISNDLVMPALLRIRRLHLEQRQDLSLLLLRIRRVAIVVLVLLAYGYYRIVADNANLAATGLLAFRRGAVRAGDHRRAVLARRQPGRRGDRSARRLRGVDLHPAAAGDRSQRRMAEGRAVRHRVAAPAGAVPPQRLGPGDAQHVLVAAGQRGVPDLHLVAFPPHAGRAHPCGNVRRPVHRQQQQRGRLARPRCRG